MTTNPGLLGPTLPPGQVLDRGGRGPHIGGLIHHMADWAFGAREAHVGVRVGGGGRCRSNWGSPPSSPRLQLPRRGRMERTSLPRRGRAPSGPNLSWQHMEACFRGVGSEKGSGGSFPNQGDPLLHRPQPFLDPPNFRPLKDALNQSFLEANCASIYSFHGLMSFFNHLIQEGV